MLRNLGKSFLAARKDSFLFCPVQHISNINKPAKKGKLTEHDLFREEEKAPEYVPKVRRKCVEFLEHNNIIFPPQSPDEPRRPAYVCHCMENIKYSYEKMWYIACLVRGMTVDEAIKQLSFVPKKGAIAVRDTILKAQELAVTEHDVEFKSNLWVSESFVEKGTVIKGLRRHARGHMGIVKYGYVHYMVTLEEGKPPEHYYYHHRPRTGEEWLAEWLEQMRHRKITNSL